MNAPTYINSAHKALARNPGGLTLEELSGKLRVKALKVSQQIRELHDACLIETTEDAGQPVYKLKAAPVAESAENGRADIPPPQYDPASVAFPSKEPVDEMGIPLSCGRPLCSPGDHHPLCKLHTSDIENDPEGLLIVKEVEPMKAYQAEERILTPEAEADRDDFEAKYGREGNCSCHVSAPCGSCMHPGNPAQQEGNDACWMAASDSEGGETDAPAWATNPALQYLAPEDYEMPPADPVLLASANKMLCERMEAVAEAIRASTIPSLEGITGAEDLAPHVKTLCDALAAAESTTTARGHTINQLHLEVADLRERLDAVTQQSIADTVAMTEKNTRLAADLKDMTRDRDLLKAENLALKTLDGSMPGFGAEHQEQRINSLTTDVINTRNALTNAINEADRLRAELATERQAREALQEAINVVDAEFVALPINAKEYVLKSPWRNFRKQSTAKSAATAEARRGKRTKVFALVPIGEAIPGAEWRGQ